MFRNYFLVAIRNFWRNKTFSAINILGLAIGISAALVIFLIVQYDFSFDRFEKNGDRIYRIVSDYSMQGNPGHTRGIPAPLADAVKKEISGLDQTVSFRYYSLEKLAVPGADSAKPKTFKEQRGVIFADAQYFDLLSYTWLAGSAHSALEEPNRVVLTESRAKLYFPSLPYASLIGRKIMYDDSLTALVSGVVQDLDQQAHTDFNFKEFISLPTVLDNQGLRKNFYWDDWGSTTSDQQLYVRLKSGIPASSVKSQLKTLFNKYRGEDAKKNHFTWDFVLQPLSDIHFNSHYGDFNTRMANRPTLNGLMLVAGFLLLLGCINFINLTTAQAAQRNREIGIRKTLGSSRRQLVLQFLSETFLTTLAATGLSLALTPLLLKVFAQFIPEGLHFSPGQPFLIGFLIVLVVLVSLLAGIYPALVLSSRKPLQVLKNQSRGVEYKTSKVRMRQALTIAQFVIAQAFIMGTLLVGNQIRFLLDQDLGFKKDAILSFSTPHADTSVSRRLYLVNELRKIPGVNQAILANDEPSSWGWWTNVIIYNDGKKELQTDVELKAGDTGYLRLFHIPLLAGRNLLPSDTPREIVINESYQQVLGFPHPQDAVGKMVSWNGKNVPIVGVIKDFHAHPLYYPIAPMVFCQSIDQCRDVIIALRPRADLPERTLAGIPDRESEVKENGWQGTISQMEKMYKKIYPDEEFNYAFLDENLASAYNGEQNISDLLKWATGLTIFISCLGLLGLVIFTTNHRIKEIGVRKVLGATVGQIVSLISKDFLKLVSLAFILATPLAWWGIHAWLDNFATRETISFWVFAGSGLLMIAIALITLSTQTVRAAMANPVESLRTE
jgi:predicted permease